MSVDRLPPQSIEAEESVLGSLMIDPDAMTAIADVVRAEDFYRNDHRLVFSAMLDLYGRKEPLDIVTVSAELDRRGDLADIGGAAWLTGLTNKTPTAVNVVHYAKLVSAKAMSRALIGVAGQIAALGYEDASDPSQSMDKAESLLLQTRRMPGKGFRHIGALMDDVYDQVEAVANRDTDMIGIPSGLSDLDRLTAGFQKSNLIIIAARTSVGKTSLALNIAERAALDEGVSVGYYSLEMSERELATRLVSSRAGIDSMRLKTGTLSDQDWRAFANAANKMKRSPLYIEDTPNISIMEARAKARRQQMREGMDLLIVDYIQLMQATMSKSDRNRVLEMSEITGGLKAIARELDIPVIALAQLNRQSEMRSGGEPPRLSDLRESGSIEQDADMVIFLWRDPEDAGSAQGDIVRLRVAKHRNGPTGDMMLWFRSRYTRFESYTNEAPM